VIEEREILPVGSDHAISVNLHVISATHRDVLQMIKSGEFREDLYYRLNGMTLHLPLFRNRSDKDELIRTLLKDECGSGETIEITEDAFNHLLAYPWPGNIRQLRNALRTAAALCRDGIIRLSNLPQEIIDPACRETLPSLGSLSMEAAATLSSPASPGDALLDAERSALLRELERMHWNISRTADALGISRNTLYRKIHKHSIVLDH
jgi:sigma-54 dependent transcriptional regulator, acetoin dehydrogenase operon transcriptional activator AcoR